MKTHDINWEALVSWHGITLHCLVWLNKHDITCSLVSFRGVCRFVQNQACCVPTNPVFMLGYAYWQVASAGNITIQVLEWHQSSYLTLCKTVNSTPKFNLHLVQRRYDQLCTGKIRIEMISWFVNRHVWRKINWCDHYLLISCLLRICPPN